jgi:hypothetical protein
MHANFDYVQCHSCGRHGQVFDGHPHDAVASWNSDQRRLAQRDRLLARLREIVCMHPLHPSKRVIDAARICIAEIEKD